MKTLRPLIAALAVLATAAGLAVIDVNFQIVDLDHPAIATR